MAWKNTSPQKIKEYNQKYYQKKLKIKRAKEKQEREEKIALGLIKLKYTVVCPMCGTKFSTNKSRKKYCCKACKELANKIQRRIKENNPKYKEQKRIKSREYSKTEAYKKTRQKYAKSQKGKEALKRYLHSEKGKAKLKEMYQRRKAKQKALIESQNNINK